MFFFCSSSVVSHLIAAASDEAFVPLKTFLQKHARAYHERHLARTYGAFAENKIIAYLTLVCGEIVLEGGQDFT
jgi:hypothetical protein